MECKGDVTTHDVYVVKNLQEPLLGRPAIEALRLIQRVESVQSTSINYREVYTKLYSGLGRMMESYKIRLRVRENAMPYAFSAPRRVPLPSQTKAKMDQDIILHSKRRSNRARRTLTPLHQARHHSGTEEGHFDQNTRWPSRHCQEQSISQVFCVVARTISTDSVHGRELCNL